jgi:hypothetical protein
MAFDGFFHIHDCFSQCGKLLWETAVVFRRGAVVVVSRFSNNHVFGESRNKKKGIAKKAV